MFFESTDYLLKRRRLIKKKVIGTYLKQIMPKISEKEKVFNILEKEVNVISAVNNAKLAPYLDIFEHYPENILLQPLGILTGFFRINDFSEESAYIVNFLSSLLKKEYYANPKRSIDNSFDSALRKVNLALSEIAKEGNINWLGRIEGAVCVLEKNNLHFSVCGNSKILLIRNQIITEVSKDLSSEEKEPNPLKTFANVSSGRLDKGDKIIVCSEDIFDIFSLNEIRKGSVRFQKEKFVQFVKTALTNKLEIIGTIIIDLFEKSEEKSVAQKKNIGALNVFSEKTFKKNTPKINNLKEILEKEDPNEYTDEKTGHIYIQEDKDNEIKKESQLGIIWLSFIENVSDVSFWTKNKLKRSTINFGRYLKKTKDQAISNLKTKQEERKRIRLEKIAQKAEEDARKSVTPPSTNISTKFFEEEIKEEIEKPEAIPEIKPEQTDPQFNLGERKNSFLEKLAKRKEELDRMRMETEEKMGGEPKKEKDLSFINKIIPHWGKAKENFLSLSKKQKIYTGIVILAIFVLPYAFIKIQDSMKKNDVAPLAQEQIPDAREVLSQEKNIVFLENLENSLTVQNPQKLIFLNNKLVAISNDKIITKDENGEIKEISWPQDYGKITQVAPMKDLNLALLYTDQNKVVSFLSATSQLKENTITIPNGSKITGAGAYLTYLYLLDSANNQIYRYPRAEGGFGEKTNWLKGSVSFNDSCCLAIDENVYLVSNGEIIKLFKGEKQDFNLEKTSVSFTAEAIFTDNETANLYVLDKTNGRIIKFGKDGSLIGQYFHEDIENIFDFTIDEKNSKAYLINSEELKSFNL